MDRSPPPPTVRSRLRAIWRWLAVFVAALMTIALPSATSAQATQRLGVCIARDTGQRPAAMMLAHRGFDCTSPQSSFGPGDFWARTPVLPKALSPALTRIRIANQWQRRLTLYALYRDGHVEIRPMDAAALTRHLKLGAEIEQALPVRAAPIARLLWRIEGAPNFRRLLAAPRLQTAATSERDNLTAAIAVAAFIGLGLALFAYNIALWVGLRRRFQLAYCAMVACFVLYGATSSAAITWLLPTLPNNVRAGATYELLAVTVAAALWFARAFFEPVPLPRRLRSAANALTAWLLTTGLAFVLFAPWRMGLLDKLHGLGYIGILVITVPLLRLAATRGWAFLAFFALAWAPPAMLAAMRVVNTYQLMRTSFYLTSNILLILAAQALLSSIAIAYRIHLVSRERDEAREKEIAARSLAATDPLTGLLNRRSFLEQAIGREEPHRLLLIDVDHFKRVNETLGHDGGDEVLRVVARALRRSTPPEALVARIGGEEFAILAPAGSPLSPDAVLDRLRSERMPFDLGVTASIGCCVGAVARETDWKTLYRCADRALFAAKAAGRDRAREADPLPAVA